MKWLESALNMIATLGVAAASGFFGASQLGTTLGTSGTALAPMGSPAVRTAPDGRSLHFGFHPPKRRRRRRALTASDRADIAFISATLGQKAGKDIAALIVART